MKTIRVIDSHTGGEPTRLIVDGGPELGAGPLAERVNRFRNEFDEIRNAVVNEPRGNEVIVGGLICQPHDPSCDAGIIFFNNLDYLGMCGHGTIGLLVTLEYLQRIKPGIIRIDTPVGVVQAELKGNAQVTIKNVPSYRYRKDVSVDIAGYGKVVGDIAWGGNWFFLVKNSQEELRVDNAGRLTEVSLRIRKALDQQGITGAEGAWIDHVELFGPAVSPDNHSRNFVLCPGGAYDRSPCGTGTSAKLACLAADGKLSVGQEWRQESILGSVFVGNYDSASPDLTDARAGESPTIIPTITGTAYVCADSKLILNPADPFCMGIRAR